MLTADEVLSLLPQRRPFRFLDRLLAIDACRAIGEYTFRSGEPFFEGHFPGNPIAPGVILLETMCQTGLVALGIYLLGCEIPREEVTRMVTLFTGGEVEFERVVRPEETVRIEARKVYFRMRKLKADVRMTRPDGTLIARARVDGVGVVQ
jgi:3-hydroxyacyl-[acyl-carrier-protein] dehydratase